MEEFFARLKEHKLVQWALGYIAVSFGLIPVMDVIAQQFGWPEAMRRGTIIVVATGFLITLVLAWYHGERGHGRFLRSELTIIATLAVLGLIVVWRVAPTATPSQATAAQAAPAPFAPPKDSLIVLPFKNLSGDPKQQYFSDGITEELTSALGQNPALRVIAWDTASTLRNTALTANQVGQKLNVANVLHGSIEREGDAVRISVELVNAISGYELWSQHYDDTFANIFAVQDKVSQAIAQALQVKFAQADLPQGGTSNPQAHDLVLKGRALLDKFDAASFEAARKDFEAAIALDPNYADAHAWLAHALVNLTQRSSLPLAATLPQIRAEAEKALALDPRNADAWVALGIVDTDSNPPDLAKAKQEFQKALALDPSNAAAHIDYGLVLPLKQNLAEQQEATLLDPDNAAAWNNVASNAQDLDDWAGIIKAAKAMIRLNPQVVDGAFGLAYAYQQLRQDDAMVAAFDLVKPANAVDKAQVAAGRLVYQSLLQPALHPQALAAVQQLAHDESNPDVADNILYLWLALGENAQALKLLQGFCPAEPIACNDLAINPLYTPLRANPEFQKLAKQYTTMTVQ